MKLSELNPNKKNPRDMDDATKEGLRHSVEEFGDMGGIVFNQTSKQLVGGHQRSGVLPKDSKIKITKKYETPTRTGTVAEGYIEVNGERFSYREVAWDSERESTALLAANKWQGKWNDDLLKIFVKELPPLKIEMAGFAELKPLGKIAPIATLAPMDEPEDFDGGEEDEETDEQYAARTSGAATGDTERVPTVSEELSRANAPSSAEVLEKTEEKMDVVGKRHMIIIDCKDAEHKAKVRALVEPIATAEAAKIF